MIAKILAEAQNWRQVSVSGVILQLREEGRLTASGAESLLASIAEDGSLTLFPGSLGLEVPMDGFFIAMLERCQ